MEILVCVCVCVCVYFFFGKRVYVADFLLTRRKMHNKFYLRTVLTEGCSLEDNLSDSSEKQLWSSKGGARIYMTCLLE